jgi:hypothetical protein
VLPTEKHESSTFALFTIRARPDSSLISGPGPLPDVEHAYDSRSQAAGRLNRPHVSGGYVQ